MNDSVKRIVTLYDYSLNPEVKGEFYPAENKLNTVIKNPSQVLSQSNLSDDIKTGVVQAQTEAKLKSDAFNVFTQRSKDTQPAKQVKTQEATEQFVQNSDWIKKNYLNAKKGFSLTRVFVALFLAVSMYGFITLAFPIIAAEASFRFSQYTSDPKTMSGTASPSARVKALDPEIAQQFNITIPKINVESRVLPEVDPVNEQEYKNALTQGIAHAKGSYLPGQGGSIFLFAHSTNDISNILTYNAKFYAVKDLNPGDQVVINYKGRKYTYEITSHQIINPSDLETIRNSNADLILSTCYPPGTDWQRLITFAKLVNTSN